MSRRMSYMDVWVNGGGCRRWARGVWHEAAPPGTWTCAVHSGEDGFQGFFQGVAPAFVHLALCPGWGSSSAPCTPVKWCCHNVRHAMM